MGSLLYKRESSVLVLGGFDGLDLLQGPAGNRQVGGHHRVHRDSQIHIVAIGISAGGDADDLTVGVHQRAAAAAPGNVGGVDNAGQGITVQLMSGGADDAGADGQPQTQRVADGVHRIAGADVRRAHQT